MRYYAGNVEWTDVHNDITPKDELDLSTLHDNHSSDPPLRRRSILLLCLELSSGRLDIGFDIFSGHVDRSSWVKLREEVWELEDEQLVLGIVLEVHSADYLRM